MAHLFAGTSGFAYPSWKPDFYPPKLPAKDFLKHYATRLNAVEINYTFRQLPKPTTLENWIQRHAGRIQLSPARPTSGSRISCACGNPSSRRSSSRRSIRCGRRAAWGPCCFSWRPISRPTWPSLTAFVEKLPQDIRCAFEFRNNSWLVDEVYRLFEKHGIALCLAESDKFEVPEVVTAGFVYVRLRKEDYSAEERAEIAERVRGMLAGGRDVYVFFKHEDTAGGGGVCGGVAEGCSS